MKNRIKSYYSLSLRLYLFVKLKYESSTIILFDGLVRGAVSPRNQRCRCLDLARDSQTAVAPMQTTLTADKVFLPLIR